MLTNRIQRKALDVHLIVIKNTMQITFKCTQSAFSRLSGGLPSCKVGIYDSNPEGRLGGAWLIGVNPA